MEVRGATSRIPYRGPSRCATSRLITGRTGGRQRPKPFASKHFVWGLVCPSRVMAAEPQVGQALLVFHARPSQSTNILEWNDQLRRSGHLSVTKNHEARRCTSLGELLLQREQRPV